MHHRNDHTGSNQSPRRHGRGNTSCEELRALIGGYALGITDPDETALVEMNLADCPDIAEELAAYRTLAEGMLYIAPDTEMPRGFSGVLEKIQAAEYAAPPQPLQHDSHQQQQHIPQQPVAPVHVLPPAEPVVRERPSPVVRWLPWVAILILTGGFLLSNLYWANQISTLTARLEATATPMPVVQVSGNSEHRELLAAQADTEATASFIWDRTNDAGSLQVVGLPQLPPDRAYQLWLVRNGESVSLGAFRVNEQGVGFLNFTSQVPIENYEHIGISPEPASGSIEPTDEHMLVGTI